MTDAVGLSIAAAACCGLGGLAAGPALVAGTARIPGVRHDAGRVVAVCVVAAVSFGGLAARLAGDPARRYALPAFLVLAGVGVALGAIDTDVRRLPDALVLPSYPVVGVLLAVAGLVGGPPGWAPLLRGLLGGLASLAFYVLLCLPRSAPLGFGDVKLAGLLGLALAWLSWATLAVGMVLGLVYGTAYGLLMVAVRRGGLARAIPFGPAMLAGALTAVLLGDGPAADWASWWVSR